MRYPKLLAAILLNLAFIACKTYTPDTDLQNTLTRKKLARDLSAPKTTLDPTGSNEPATLLVSHLALGEGVGSYDRTALLLQSSGLDDQTRKTYTLNDSLKLDTGRTYNLIVRLYLADKLVYSNENCGLNMIFVAEAGANDFSVPICVPAAK